MSSNIKKFYTSLFKYIGKNITEGEFYDEIKEIDSNDSLLNYFKAVYAFKQTNYELAEKYIKESIRLIDKEIEISSEDLFALIGEHCPYDAICLFPNRLVREENKYFLAGETLAINNKEESLAYFQRYQYFNELHLKNNLEEKDYIVVYSFRRYNEYTISDLVNNEITLSPPSRMNDPFDSIANIWSKTSWLEKFTKEKRHLIQLSRSFNYFRIRSFTANRETYETDDNVLKQILMWSFYAGEHTGICIKYRLSRHFIKKEQNDNYSHLRILPIEYVESVELKPQDKITTQSAYGMKQLAWKNESEVRLLSYNPTTEDCFVGESLDENSRIEEIVFGILCPEKDRKTVYNLIKKQYKYDVIFSEMTNNPENNIYNLVKRKYNP